MSAPKITKTPSRRLQYVAKVEHNESTNAQAFLAGKVLDIYNELGDGEEKEQEIEFFFYTNTAEKAKELKAALKKLRYKIYRTNFAERFSSYSISGSTNKMKMDVETIARWS